MEASIATANRHDLGGAQPRGPAEEQLMAEASLKMIAATVDALEAEATQLNDQIDGLERTLQNAQRLRNSAVARLDALRESEVTEKPRVA